MNKFSAINYRGKTQSVDIDYTKFNIDWVEGNIDYVKPRGTKYCSTGSG